MAQHFYCHITKITRTESIHFYLIKTTGYIPHISFDVKCAALKIYLRRLERQNALCTRSLRISIKGGKCSLRLANAGTITLLWKYLCT